jgi:hypothetical protein
MGSLTARLLPVVVTFLVTADVCRAHFVDGVERFDGTIKDTATWTETTGASITQNGFLAIGVYSNCYTSHTFTLGVGQGVGARMMLPPSTQDWEEMNLYLTNRSNPMTAPVWDINGDSRFVALQVMWEKDFDRTIFRAGNGSTNSRSGAFIASLPGNHTGEWFDVDLFRLATNIFSYTVRDSNGVEIGTLTRDVTTPVAGGPTFGTVPPQLYIALGQRGHFDDIRIIPEPTGATALLLAAASAAVRRRRSHA